MFWKSSAAVLLLVTANAAVADPMEDARKAYNNCLVDLVAEHLDKKSGQKAFETATKSACPDKRKKFMDIVTKEERGYGSSQSEAATFATEEADGIVQSFTSGYGGYATSGTRPVKEK